MQLTFLMRGNFVPALSSVWLAALRSEKPQKSKASPVADSGSRLTLTSSSAGKKWKVLRSFPAVPGRDRLTGTDAVVLLYKRVKAALDQLML